MMSADRSRARALAQRYVAQGDSTGWFEALYAEAQRGAAAIPWADLQPNPNFVSWLDSSDLVRRGGKALKVGCGLGDDAEELARRGFETTAFDISPTAVAMARQRFPHSKVDYRIADLLNSPTEWRKNFDFVLEAYTLQVLPPPERLQAIDRIAGFVADGGSLLVITRGRDASEDSGRMPWPLTKEELLRFESGGLEILGIMDYVDAEDPPVRRFRALFRRPGPAYDPSRNERES